MHQIQLLNLFSIIFCIYKFKMIQLYSKTLCGVEAFGYEHVDNTINS